MKHDLVLGLGGCVDYEIEWDPGVIENLVARLGIGPGELDRGTEVIDERSLVVSLLAFVRDGVGGERALASSDIGRRFAELFGYRVTLGGTCVRAALAIAQLGVPSTVHLVSIDENVRRLLPAEVGYLSSASHDTLDPHVIVQFPEGARIRVGDDVIVSPSANRVIYVDDPPNREMVLSPRLPDLLEQARAFLACGFNVMLDPDKVRDRIAFLQSAMTRLPADALVFYEDAGFHDPSMRAVISQDYRGRIDVHSLNEDELQSYLGRPVDLLDVDDVVSALREFQPFALGPTVVVHTKHWALAYGARVAQLGPSLAAGIDLAGTRFRVGDVITAVDLQHTQWLPRQAAGEAFAVAISARLGDAVCCIPARVLDVTRPTTVGLGDTFVGGFLAEFVYPGTLAEAPDAGRAGAPLVNGSIGC
ncbi:MAG: hypothetical protein IPM11_05535 [Micropruina sp.]|nr:hypothetical protein [Micropruina sp.]